MIVLDTSVLVRFFSGDDKIKADKVEKLLCSNNELILLESVVVELIFTLKEVYKADKNELNKVCKLLTSRPNIHIDDYVRRAFEIFGTNNISITDSLVIAKSEGNELASYDQKLIKISKLKSVV